MYQYSQVLLDPNSSPEAIAQAKTDMYTAFVAEAIEPDEATFGIPLDDIVRHWDDIAPVLSAAIVAGREGSDNIGRQIFRGPAAKAFDWEHIFDRHTPWGRTAQQSGRKDVFENMTEGQIKGAVQTAWQERKRISTQIDPITGGERILYQGVDPVSGYTIEMWFNSATKIVETAYPIQP